MRRHQPRTISGLAAGLLTLALAALFVAYVFGARLPDQRYEVSAVFRDAHDIKPGSPVRIAGIAVGEVTGVEPVPGGATTAEVRMRIEDDGLPLHQDARASIRPRIFLEGNFFVDLEPGSPSAPRLGSGATLPVTRTSSLVTFGDVTGTLRLDTRRGLQDLLAEVDDALDGAGARGFRRSIPHWEPAYRDSAIVADALRGARGDLSGFLRDGGTVAAAIDRSPADLRALVRNLQQTAGAFAARTRELDATLAVAPDVVREARPALAAVRAALPSVRRLAVEARPGLRRIAPALQDALPLTRELAGLLTAQELGGLVRDLRPAVPDLATGLRTVVPLLQQVRALASCQNETVLPTLKSEVVDAQFPASGPVYQEFAKALPGLAGESRPQDANGQWIRALFTGGNYAYPAPAGQTLLTSRPLAGVNPGLPARGVPPFRPDVACETQARPDLESRAAPAPTGFRVDQGSGAARAITDVGLPVAQRFLRRELQRTGLKGRLTLRDTPLRRSELSDRLGRLP